MVITKIVAGPMGYSRSAEMSRQEFVDLVREEISMICNKLHELLESSDHNKKVFLM